MAHQMIISRWFLKFAAKILNLCKGASSECGLCPAGFFCDTEGTVEKEPGAKKCPVGTFSNQIGLTRTTGCYDCPPGYLCDETGISILSDHKCPLDKLCVNNAETDCPAGFFCPEGSSEGIPCTPGFYCPGGSSPGGQVGGYLVACASGAGVYCTGGTDTSTPCPKGTSNLNINDLFEWYLGISVTRF